MHRFAKFILPLLLAVLLATPATAMHVSTSGQGDALIFPLYVALDGGWTTQFTITNISEQYATVAKFVIRSWKNSQELLDFLIFLSPADVWTGTVSYDPAQGAIVMQSTDDSVLTQIGQFASPSNPLVKPLAATSDSTDNGFLGYAYVINAATNPKPLSPGVAEASKTNIFEWYYSENLIEGGLVAVNGAPLVCPATDAPACVYPRNILTGYVDVSWSAGGSFALKPVALVNYQNKVWIDTGQETWLGKPGESSMTLYRLEDLLAKQTVRLPYYNSDGKGHTFHFFTFPDKATSTAVKRGFWNYLSDNEVKARTCVTAEAKIFDLTEKFSVFSPSPVAQMCTEIFWIEALPNVIPFQEGWIRYSLRPETGVWDGPSGPPIPSTRKLFPPVIPFVINVGPQGLFSLQTAVDPGPYNRFGFFDLVPGIPAPTPDHDSEWQVVTTGSIDPVWDGWDSDPGLSTGLEGTINKN